MAAPLSRRDLDFMLYEWLDATALIERERYSEHSRETFDSILDLSEDIAIKRFAPHNEKADQKDMEIPCNGELTIGK